ncbi:AmmeMemoRadiSam system radical SAM enzyme [Candidatus Falkowbacteria bacterium]|nr:AmmeMemoRadiSam system radical SAM enzyme [Candidatus Falkowbacteria bacterium]
MQEAKFYKKLDNLTVVCELCRHFCTIADQQTGICQVRKNINGELFSLVYGYPAALNVDPIEKKPLFHFQPGSLSYSLGTLGCNFKCANCQNWDISQAKNTTSLNLPLSRGTSLVEPEKIVSEALINDCSSISYTYNEPTIFAEYALEIMKLARAKNLKNVWVTNGYMSDSCLEAILPYLDAVNVDLKSFDENFYLKNCRAKLRPVLENLKTLKKSGVHLEITTLIIPGLSDDYEMLKSLAEFIVNELGDDVPWHLAKFSPAVSWKLKKAPPTSEEKIFEACDIGKNASLKYVYAGNIPGDERENTYCPACHELAISRFGYEIERFDNHGRCAYCDKNLDIFE